MFSRCRVVPVVAAFALALAPVHARADDVPADVVPAPASTTRVPADERPSDGAIAPGGMASEPATPPRESGSHGQVDRVRSKADRQRAARLLALGGGGLAYIASETIFKDRLAPDACRWCAVNGVDRRVRDGLLWDDRQRAHQLSNLTGYATAPIAAASLLLVSTGDLESGRWTRLVDDMIPVLESVIYSQLLVQAMKFSFGRSRPFVQHATEPLEPEPDQNLSFLSGHSALTFAIATSAGTVAQRRGYRLAPVIWGVGLGLAGTTAYLRIAADKHYATDVLAGAAFGTLAGLLVPRLTGSLPERLSIVPVAGGAGIAATF